jgi:hypothetical protein
LLIHKEIHKNTWVSPDLRIENQIDHIAISRSFRRFLLDVRTKREQAGFRSSRPCVDQISTVRMLIEQSNAFLSALYLLFIDSEKAFDSIDRD